MKKQQATDCGRQHPQPNCICKACCDSRLVFDRAQNLDGMTPADLQEYITQISIVAKSSNDWLLLRYARVKQDAMKHRAAGMIGKALQLEADCEKIYRQLPRELQW